MREKPAGWITPGWRQGGIDYPWAVSLVLIVVLSIIGIAIAAA